MSEATTKQRVTFEIIEQQNHVRELLDLPVSSETPGLDALLDAQTWTEKAEGKFETGVTPLWYAIRALGLGEGESAYEENGEASYITSKYRNRYPVRWHQDRRRAIREIQHRYNKGRLSKAQARSAYLDWELECIFVGSKSSPIPVDRAGVETRFYNRLGRNPATCMPSRTLCLDEYARITVIFPRTINSFPCQVL